MEKLKMHSPNFAEENIAKLAALFPGCVTESINEDGKPKKAIDFDLLRQELATSIVEGPRERYHLNWPGKQEARLAANAPIDKTLRPCREESVDFDTTENLFIEGDNLDALKLLQETYLGKVKMIYIDPPYNTGKDFIYADNFAESTEEYLLKTGQKDEEGSRFVANTASNGRFHSDWLSMMYPRLKLAKNLLKDDGAIFVSIDDNEAANLRKLCDKIFGEENFVAQFVWAAGRKNDSKLVSNSHEYVVVYANDKGLLKENKTLWRQRKQGLDKIYAKYNSLKNKYGNNYLSIQENLKNWFKSLPDGHPSKRHSHYSCVDKKGIYFPDNISWPGGGGPKYDVLHPITNKPCKAPSRGWMFADPQRMKEIIKDDRVHFGEDEAKVPCIKSHLEDRELEVPYSVFYQDGRASTKRLRALMGGDYFEHPKDEAVIESIVAFAGHEDRGSIVMDFFAGSGTTAHAVMKLNAEDGGKRKFIMVQLPEICDEKSEAFKAGYKNIAEISKERIRRAGKKIKQDAIEKNKNEKQSTLLEDPNTPTKIDPSSFDVGFRVLKVDTSNMADVYRAPDAVEQSQLNLLTDNIKDGRTFEDLLFQVLLNWGVDLTLPVTKETIDNREVFFVDGNALAACFEKNGKITEDFCKELAGRQPLRVVLRDSGFKDDSVKINVEQIFKLMSPHTDVKTI